MTNMKWQITGSSIVTGVLGYPVAADNLQPGQWVYDLVYTPRLTRLLRDAEERGCCIVDGTAMLIHQGAEAFKIWTGKNAPIEIMRKMLLSQL